MLSLTYRVRGTLIFQPESKSCVGLMTTCAWTPLRLRVLSLLRSCLSSELRMWEKNLKIYSFLVYCVNFILYCSALTLLNCGTISAYLVMQIEHESLREKKRGGGRENMHILVMKNNLNKSLREKEVEKKKIYIKVQIDRATTTLAASTS